MEHREEGLQILYNRIKEKRTELGIETFKRTPSEGVLEKDLLCVFMTEGPDRIIKFSDRSYGAYPVRRELEVVFELINVDSFDIRKFCTDFRRVILSSTTLNRSCIVRELRAIGPQGYRSPGIIGMNLILGMNYVDNG